jgi:glycerol uptake facilitator protein
MSAFVGEIVGTALLILLGNGAVAGAVLRENKSYAPGWITITFGWGMAVFVAVSVVGQFSGAHINPAVTVGLATAGLFDWSSVPMYIFAQLLGAMTGALLVWLAFRDHFKATPEADAKLAVHCTGPAIRNYPNNLVTEVIGTLMLVFGVLYLVSPGFFSPDGQMLEAITIEGTQVGFGLGSLAALPVALLVVGIGISLGGPTGYAINPARDLGPRIMHALLPIPGKRDSDWAYSWVPVVGPLIGAVLAASLFLFFK